MRILPESRRASAVLLLITVALAKALHLTITPWAASWEDESSVYKVTLVEEA